MLPDLINDKRFESYIATCECGECDCDFENDCEEEECACCSDCYE